LKDDGTITIAVHWLYDMVTKFEIDILYAEHYYEWTYKAMSLLTSQLNLIIVKVEHIPEQQGGSIRFWIRKNGKQDDTINKIIKMEKDADLYELRTIEKLQLDANKKRDSLRNIIEKIKNDKKKISIWSVPAKIATILNFCRITCKDIDYAYEVAETKIGRYIPGANILIKDEKELSKDMPDYLIVGAWNYIDFAKKNLEWYVKKGGKLINPLTCDII
jgi:hypothetical protein